MNALERITDILGQRAPSLLAMFGGLLIAAACTKSTSTGTRQPASVAGPTVPIYAAEDYGKAGSLLSRTDISRLKEILRKVKPCQRSLVRYSFGGEPAGGPAIFFFAPQPGEAPHVIGTADEIYMPFNGSVVPMSDNEEEDQMLKEGIQWDVDHQPCPAASKR